MANHELQLMAYVDGELDADGVREVEALLATDPEARLTVAKFRETAALLRAACAEGFYADATAHIALVRPAHRMVRRLAGYAAVAVVAGIVGFGGGLLSSGRPTSGEQVLINDIAEYHKVQSQETKHLVEVPASESADLTTWLGRRLDRHLEIPDLSPAGLHFAGGRMEVAGQQPVAALIYTRDNGLPVGLCIARTPDTTSALRIDQRDGETLATWADGAYTYIVVGDLSAAAARAIAERAAPQLVH